MHILLIIVVLLFAAPLLFALLRFAITVGVRLTMLAAVVWVVEHLVH